MDCNTRDQYGTKPIKRRATDMDECDTSKRARFKIELSGSAVPDLGAVGRHLFGAASVCIEHVTSHAKMLPIDMLEYRVDVRSNGDGKMTWTFPFSYLEDSRFYLALESYLRHIAYASRDMMDERDAANIVRDLVWFISHVTLCSVLDQVSKIVECGPIHITQGYESCPHMIERMEKMGLKMRIQPT
jgi:hypothetical protein